MPSVLYHNEIIEYSFSRKQVKNINLRIRADGSVSVSAPRSVPFSAVENFVLSNAANYCLTLTTLLSNQTRNLITPSFRMGKTVLSADRKCLACAVFTADQCAAFAEDQKNEIAVGQLPCAKEYRNAQFTPCCI